MEHKTGDRIRILRGPGAGEKGIILAFDEDSARVKLGTHEAIDVSLADLQNYSRAARRAWQTRPKRAGRPRGSGTSRKKMVSIRIDREVWERLGMAVEQGLIPSRERAVNEWLAEKAIELGLVSEAETLL